ncbi:MAG: hypothetical protein ABJE66_07080 [Deltaproteobacteria bacterium]
MKEQVSTWDEVRRIADELELKIHLASMDARDRWRVLQPRLVEIEKSIEAAGNRAGDVVEHEVASVGAALRRLWDDVARPTKPA